MLRTRRLRLVFFLFTVLPLFAVDRSAFIFTNYDLKTSVRPDQRALDVEGTIEVRNDSAAPQSAIPLQISSSLTWLRVSIGDEQPSWISQTYTSDIAHTGALSEAIITLDKPLAPKASLKISIHYAGTVTRDSTRLTRIGTPQDIAERSDWDQISRNFTAVRGLGFVTWYPVSIDAVCLSNGDEVFDAIAAWKQREFEAQSKVSYSNAEDLQEKSTRIAMNGFNLSGTPTFVVAPLFPLERPHIAFYATAEHTSIAR